MPYHGCLQFLLTQMPISRYLGCLQFFLMQMPVFCYHGCLQILFTQKEVILLTQFIGPSWLAVTTSYSLDALLDLLPSSYYFGDPRFTSLCCFTPNILGIAAHLGSSSHRSGPGLLRGLRPNSYLHLTNANILSSNATE
ncbi:hypothetical protein K503DRAFT_54761 [Rhizopogon vinicolor AM-OR11-026]|uniref:Uncharacterized protein n=1 Tax=Rhizopogon vinicolor AM-OR11-026 TaxID=1314800 RepID=A0A1B7MGL7_9AGAM|nr:hypothetical protein K503DRAFT_54761 [Rhizopogon vinicolor AM-OR11-026]